MGLIEAYFDASGTHSDAKDLCLAGYLFKQDAATAFDEDWRCMLGRYGLPYFHMKECAHATGVFKTLGLEGSDLAAREAIDLIKRYASQGIAFTVDKSISAELRKGSMWKNEYSFIVGQVFFAIRDFALADESKSEVACLFENGDDGRGQAVEAAQLILKQVDFRETCRISSFKWADQNKETPLQAADMLAWHVNLWRRKRRNGTLKKRGDFKSLLEVPMIYHHWDRSSVDYLKAMRASR
ncbi:MAG: DUF3800 domain-containing protein [Gammaproteobacteria bacterium]|nr:DUF3800 domain-containing protein [Gammaproteobacteria bacterium]MBU1775762.1 DUF3800 domain-containing protein [Gammaproteobacteria bacterium]MBU1970003.1 DUF3800 domain-containing protein [Gammaproteobacteria bacterium]